MSERLQLLSAYIQSAHVSLVEEGEGTRLTPPSRTFSSSLTSTACCRTRILAPEHSNEYAVESRMYCSLESVCPKQCGSHLFFVSFTDLLCGLPTLPEALRPEVFSHQSDLDLSALEQGGWDGMNWASSKMSLWFCRGGKMAPGTVIASKSRTFGAKKPYLYAFICAFLTEHTAFSV